MRSINPVVSEDGVCFVVVNKRDKPLIEPTRDMGVVMDALGNATLESEALANTAFEYLTGHRWPECRHAKADVSSMRPMPVMLHLCRVSWGILTRLSLGSMRRGFSFLSLGKTSRCPDGKIGTKEGRKMQDLPGDRIRLADDESQTAPVSPVIEPKGPVERTSHHDSNHVLERERPHRRHNAIAGVYIVRAGQWAIVAAGVALAVILWRHAPITPNASVWHTNKAVDSIGVAVGALMAGSIIWKLAFRAVRVVFTLALLVGVGWLFWHFY